MNGTKITMGMIAAIIAAKARSGSRKMEFIEQFSGIPQSDWDISVENPFENPKVMSMLTRNMFINSIDFYSSNMVFIAENIGQFINPELDPIAYYLSQIDQPGIQVITSDQMDIKQWLQNHPNQTYSSEAYEDVDPRLLFMIKTSSPDIPISLKTSQSIAETIGPQLYHDVWYNINA